MRLLVVEDEARVAAFLTRGLRARGHDVEHAATGAEALERVGDGHAHDLVLLDLGLPDVRGLDLLRALRAVAPRLRIIVLSARAWERDRGLRSGADEFLIKPVPFAALAERVAARPGDAVSERTHGWQRSTQP